MQQDWKEKLNELKKGNSLPVDNSPIIDSDENQPDSLKSSLLRVLTDKKGRNGKIATIIEGFEEDAEKVGEIAKTLKYKLGTGGSFRNNEILIQGDRKEEVIKLLKNLGFKIAK